MEWSFFAPFISWPYAYGNFRMRFWEGKEKKKGPTVGHNSGGAKAAVEAHEDRAVARYPAYILA